MRKGHAFLPPSGAAQWKRCAKWATMNAKYPQGDTPHTLEGTAAHWVLEKMMEDSLAPLPPVAPNGEEITEDMKDGATLALEVFAKRISGWPLLSEDWVAINRIHINCWGHLDVGAYHSEHRVLEVFEYKYGHEYVEETGNEQMICYAVGLLEVLPKVPITVNLTVIQPRCFGVDPVRTWSTKPGELDTHIAELRKAAEAAHEPNPKGTPGPACDHCPGAAHCDELKAQAAIDATRAFEVLPVDVPIEQTGRELEDLEQALERLTARVSGLREVVRSALQRGQSVMGFELTPGRGKTVWSVPPAEVIAMGQLMGVQLSKPGIITPKQAEKAGLDASMVKACSQPLPGELRLSRVDANRAAKIFTLQEGC